MKRATMFAVLALSVLAGGCDESQSSQPSASEAPAAAKQASEQRMKITVKSDGYHPSEVEVPAGQPVTLVFRRVDEAGCADTVVFPSQDIERELPLNEDVEVELTPSEAGEIAFTCGMNMLKGKVVAK